MEAFEGGLESKAEGLSKDKAKKFYRFLALQASAQIDRVLSKFPHVEIDSLIGLAIPPIVERKVDGSLVALSRELSIELYTPANAIADLKTGEFRSFHKYVIAGYALALEADEEIEVNYGFTIYVRVEPEKPTPIVRVRPHLIDDGLRREFLELRDEAYNLLSHGKDPGKPARCPDYCPYHPICMGEKL